MAEVTEGWVEDKGTAVVAEAVVMLVALGCVSVGTGAVCVSGGTGAGLLEPPFSTVSALLAIKIDLFDAIEDVKDGVKSEGTVL